MLAIFDDVAACESVRGLFLDAAVSLFRQWALRPEFRRTAPGEPAAVTSGDVPRLASLDNYAPRPAAMLIGCVLSVALLYLVFTGSTSPRRLPFWLIGTYGSTGSVLPVSRSSLTATKPDTLVRLGREPEDPWRAVASIYFKLIPVLGSLDANGDFVLSPWEVVTAPSALRRLDLNHDGKLSPEECGFSFGPGSQDAPELAVVREAQKRFMLIHPVLAALDADHDGEISAEEILNSSRYLRTLDSNGDGVLTPDEVMPDHTVTQAAAILVRLDKDRNGWISIPERESEEAEPLREILSNADRNRDGVTTLPELTKELRIREETTERRTGR